MTTKDNFTTRMPKVSIPARFLSAFMAGLMVFWPAAVSARNLPMNPTVIKGEVNINVSGNNMNIDQLTNKAIVNWESFDIGAGFAVDINQISKNASMLARVTGTNLSEIYGRLSATGALYLINPNGILFGSGAVVDVNRLIASTMDINNDDFMAGRLKFTGDSTASVINEATINANSAALIAKNVENRGVINTPNGQAA
ncbi:MAG: filamentous hemagglutinin N-terminal domain-containing protein, partial [Victivallales bacterium]|nr:filamentous hemagglutinin N-terminal domain-containing protein [Victivallales bacterium]